MKKISTYFILAVIGFSSYESCFGQTTDLAPNQYELSITGDTLNRTNDDGVRIGLWNVYFESRFGDDSYFEVGKFALGKKHGKWSTYTKDGFLTQEINYFNGYKNGEIKFYDRGRLICRGNYRALRTDVAYDTILVENPTDNSYTQKVVPTSLGSVRHGFWTYFKPPFNKIYKVEEYQVDILVYSHDYENERDSMAIQKRIDMFPHNSNELPPGIWTIDRGKKARRFTDFPENLKGVKPNPGKKHKH